MGGRNKKEARQQRHAALDAVRPSPFEGRLGSGAAMGRTLRCCEMCCATRTPGRQQERLLVACCQSSRKYVVILCAAAL